MPEVLLPLEKDERLLPGSGAWGRGSEGALHCIRIKAISATENQGQRLEKIIKYLLWVDWIEVTVLFSIHCFP